jgi:hypothetical protein
LRTFGAILLVATALALPTGSAQSQQTRPLYKYTDENGVTQFTDKIPPEHANRDRNILNQHGVPVDFEEGEVTEEERAINAAREAAAEADRKAKADVARKDRMLLETYLSVADIEDLRKRRLELLESQIKINEIYLGNLRKKLVELQSEASRYKPYTTQPDAPQIPDNLAREISQTTASIANYEQTLARTRADQEALRTSFDEDIARFRELRGG